TQALGNSGDGVILFSSSKANTVGGTAAGAGNLVAFNAVGVVVGGNSTDGSTGNAILGNSIFSNGALGIDLGSPGVTANDTNDGDTGPNNLQNFPALTSAATNGSTTTTITGTINSTASTTFRIEFFSSPSADPSGFGEGKVFLGSTNVTTDSTGNFT